MTSKFQKKGLGAFLKFVFEYRSGQTGTANYAKLYVQIGIPRTNEATGWIVYPLIQVKIMLDLGARCLFRL